MRVSKGLEVSISLTMLGAAALIIIGSFMYLKDKGEQRIEIKREKTKYSYEEAKDWAEDSTVSIDRRSVYEYWQSK